MVRFLMAPLVTCLRNAFDDVAVILIGGVNDFEQDAFRSAVSVESLDVAHQTFFGLTAFEQIITVT